jgi:hypothetical protein
VSADTDSFFSPVRKLNGEGAMEWHSRSIQDGDKKTVEMSNFKHVQNGEKLKPTEM